MTLDNKTLKTLVDDALERADLHPDRRAVLQEWRDDNTSKEEREAALTDDEREERRQQDERDAKSKREEKSDEEPISPTQGTQRRGK